MVCFIIWEVSPLNCYFNPTVTIKLHSVHSSGSPIHQGWVCLCSKKPAGAKTQGWLVQGRPWRHAHPWEWEILYASSCKPFLIQRLFSPVFKCISVPVWSLQWWGQQGSSRMDSLGYRNELNIAMSFDLLSFLFVRLLFSLLWFLLIDLLIDWLIYLRKPEGPGVPLASPDGTCQSLRRQDWIFFFWICFQVWIIVINILTSLIGRMLIKPIKEGI